MIEANDIDLVHNAQFGDSAAIGELYDKHNRQIFLFVWSRVKDRPLAEDITGEVFTRMVKSLPGFKQEGVPFRAWLYRIARNLITDHYRKHGRFTTVPVDTTETAATDDGPHNPEPMIEKKLTLERVYRALEQIDSAQKDVVVLRFLLGFSLQEAAAALDKTTAAVKSLQHRGLKSLRIVLFI